MFGLPADTALAISLSKRVRELALSVPGLLLSGSLSNVAIVCAVASRMDADQGTLMSATAVNLQSARRGHRRTELDPVARQRGDGMATVCCVRTRLARSSVSLRCQCLTAIGDEADIGRASRSCRPASPRSNFADYRAADLERHQVCGARTAQNRSTASATALATVALRAGDDSTCSSARLTIIPASKSTASICDSYSTARLS
jgi:hypothetical protein